MIPLVVASERGTVQTTYDVSIDEYSVRKNSSLAVD
jgi:hypothetical protein